MIARPRINSLGQKSGHCQNVVEPEVKNGRVQLTGNSATCKTLSQAEEAELKQCESIIAKGWVTFLEVGSALTTIRDHQLHRKTFPSFEAYCRDKWQFGRTYAYRLINAAEVVRHLSTIGNTPLPANEAQVRPLVGLEPDQIRKVWLGAIEDGKGRSVTANLVKLKALLYRHEGTRLPNRSKTFPGNCQTSVCSRDASEAFKILDQLEHAMRNGCLSETILCLMAKLRIAVQRLI